jgi:hypothetical protein
MLNVLDVFGGYKINFSEMLPNNKMVLIGDVFHIPESFAYKIIFINNDVSEQNVKAAINHALQKVYRFIDNYKV